MIANRSKNLLNAFVALTLLLPYACVGCGSSSSEPATNEVAGRILTEGTTVSGGPDSLATSPPSLLPHSLLGRWKVDAQVTKAFLEASGESPKDGLIAILQSEFRGVTIESDRITFMAFGDRRDEAVYEIAEQDTKQSQFTIKLTQFSDEPRFFEGGVNDGQVLTVHVLAENQIAIDFRQAQIVARRMGLSLFGLKRTDVSPAPTPDDLAKENSAGPTRNSKQDEKSDVHEETSDKEAVDLAETQRSAETSLNSRVWTSSDGRKVEAAFVEFKDDKVVLRRKSDGKTFSVPLSRLGESDQQWANEQSKSRDSAVPVQRQPSEKQTESATEAVQRARAVRMLRLVNSSGLGDPNTSSERLLATLKLSELNTLAKTFGVNAFDAATVVVRSHDDSQTFLNRAKEAANDENATAVAQTCGTRTFLVATTAASSHYDSHTFLERAKVAASDEKASAIAEACGVSLFDVVGTTADSHNAPKIQLDRVKTALDDPDLKVIAETCRANVLVVANAAAEYSGDTSRFLDEARLIVEDADVGEVARALECRVFTVTEQAMLSGRPKAFLSTAKKLLKDHRTELLAKQAERTKSPIVLLGAGADDPSAFLDNGLAAMKHDRMKHVAEALGLREGTVALAVADSGRKPDEFMADVQKLLNEGKLNGLAEKSGWSIGAEGLLPPSTQLGE